LSQKGLQSELEGIMGIARTRPRRLTALPSIRAALVVACLWPAAAVGGDAPEGAILLQRGRVEVTQLRHDPEARFVLIQFDAPVSREERREFEAHGVTLLGYVPENAYWARLDDGPSSIYAIEPPGRVIGWGTPARETKLSLGFTPADLVGEDRGGVNLTVFAGVGEPEVRDALHDIDPGATLEHLHGRVFQIELRRHDVLSVADLEIVQWVEPAIEAFTLDNADSAALLNIPVLHQSPSDLSGAGIRVAVFDACYPDLDHPDFGGRISIARTAQWCIDQGLFEQSHPTHVAGTIASSGVGDPAAKGMAPASYVYSYTFALSHYDDLVSDFSSLDVRLSNHSYSWGSYPYGAYEQNASTIDDIVRQSGVAMFWSSGNDGFPEEWGGFTPGGWTSQRNGGLAKNAFSVCALNEGIYIGNYFVKLDSSRGPTLDGRVKPEFCAQGADVYSLEPAASCGSPPCYGEKDGTSQASPAVAGGSALLHELHEKTQGSPLPLALLRAVLIHSAIDLHEDNSARWWNGMLPSDATVGPDYVTGWGLPDFAAAADLLLGDAWLESSVTEGATDQWTFEVTDASTLRATLAWVDEAATPGAALTLVNDIDLEVEAPGGTIHLPWILDKDDPGAPATSGRNGVDISEQVVVEAPAAGLWKVRVIGANLPFGASDQDYALVVTGAPEPSRWLLLAAGLGCLGVLYRLRGRGTA
jgi:hypothetical protein